MKKILFYSLAVILGGCVPVLSLHQLYTKESIVFEEKLLGVWVDDPNNPETTWDFERPEKQDPNDKAYRLTFSGKDGKKGLFTAHLVKLDNKLFLDVYPAESPCDVEDPNKVRWPFNIFFMVPAHTFLKVGSIGPELKMSLTNQDKIKEFITENPQAVRHEIVEENVVFTASPKELQEFIKKYADDKRVFVDEMVLQHK